MATIVNTPSSPNSGGDGSGLGVVVGIVIALLLIALFVIYGLPAMRGTGDANGGTNINVDVPNPINPPASQ